ncbi:tyrosine-type recombinase/integrase [Catelliglobosispora koreensis]|uniref:tyrosine-type recombinase/integrase n=1 Tax=Catelliglobosispora koreensis TaxID=129052 RepID=UPI001FE1CF69|nr:site-specific integrase [Catelliglobosispora koreensis]
MISARALFGTAWEAVMGMAPGVFFDKPSGSFGFRMDLPRQADGSRRQAKRVGFATDVEAAAERDRLRLVARAGTQRARLAGTMKTLCEGWLESRSQELSSNSVYNYRWLLELTFPYIGGQRASVLTGSKAEDVYRKLEALGYSRTTLRTLDLVLTKAFGDETGRHLGARKPRPSDDERLVWTLNEVQRFLAVTVGDRRHVLWRLMAVTGLRRGEVCGLKWEDLNLDFGMLTVCRQRIVEEKPRRIVEKPPKSHNGRRTIAVDDETVELLRKASLDSQSVYVFTGRTGMPLRPDNVTGQFNKIAKRAGVRPLGPHQLRHLLASSLLDLGYGIHEVAERLGHDPATLMKYYTRVNAERRIQAGRDAAQLMLA